MPTPHSDVSFGIHSTTESATEPRDTSVVGASGPTIILLKDRPGAGELKYLLLSAIESERAAAIDMSTVEKLPMPAFQIILSAAVTFQARGMVLSVKNAPFVFVQTAEILGFPKDLGFLLETGLLAPNRKAGLADNAPQALESVIAITIRSSADFFERAIDIRNVLAGLEGFGVLVVRTSLARLPPLDQLDSALCYLDFDIVLKSPIGIERVDDYMALHLKRGEYSITYGVSDATFPPLCEDEGEDVYWYALPEPVSLHPAPLLPANSRTLAEG